MATLQYVFTDAALTTAYDTASPLTLEALASGSADGVIYVGLADAAQQIQAASDPGVDPITITIADSAAGSGAEAADIKLATSSAGLDSATGGASLSLGATIQGGAANRAEVHIRWANTGISAASTEISLTLNSVTESTI